MFNINASFVNPNTLEDWDDGSELHFVVVNGTDNAPAMALVIAYGDRKGDIDIFAQTENCPHCINPEDVLFVSANPLTLPAPKAVGTCKTAINADDKAPSGYYYAAALIPDFDVDGDSDGSSARGEHLGDNWRAGLVHVTQPSCLEEYLECGIDIVNVDPDATFTFGDDAQPQKLVPFTWPEFPEARQNG